MYIFVVLKIVKMSPFTLVQGPSSMPACIIVRPALPSTRLGSRTSTRVENYSLAAALPLPKILVIRPWSLERERAMGQSSLYILISFVMQHRTLKLRNDNELLVC